MYLLILLLVPLLYLYNSYLAIGLLIAAIVVMYVGRTRARRARALESQYRAGYED